jgi:hypothetical protein
MNHQKIITLSADKPFPVVLSGNIQSDSIIIFVHGFGVTSNSRGLFTATENEFENTLYFMRSDFADMGNHQITAIPISQQIQRFQCVINYSKTNFPHKHIIFIGHSQGCIIIAKAMPSQSKILLLAPPPDPVYDNFIHSAGWNYPGSHLNLQGQSIMVRSDKTTIHAHPSFWHELKQIDSTRLYMDLAIKNNMYILQPENDYQKNNQNLKDLHIDCIQNADHDFHGESRLVLLQKLRELL